MATAVVNEVRRLAQYRPFDRGGLELRAVLRDLVLAIAAINDGRVGSLFECRRAFVDCWSIDVEVDELRPVIEDLLKEGQAERVGKGFRLSPQLLGELQARAHDWNQIEDRAFREWELAVRQLNPQVSDAEMELLGADLREWLHLIIVRHGAEAALMLYPEEERARGFFEEVDSHGFESLPERPQELRQQREQVLPMFIRAPSPDQRRFLAGQLNTSFYMTVLTIDPAAEQLVQGQLAGHRIYLDTNFLYAVLGAAPPEEVYSSRRLIQMSQDLGFEFAVTPWTMDELRTSIAGSRRDIDQQKAFIRPQLAETMLRTSGDKGFNRYYWQVYAEKKTQPKDVFDRLEHVERELEAFGIKEVDAGCARIDQQEERIRDYSSLLNSERWPYQKEWVVLEHDAKCRLLIERLRGVGNLRVSNARFWFLTYDARLPRFAERVPDNGDASPVLPFCISPSALVQIIRALTPRTEDFDRTVVDLLTSPFVGYRRAVDAAVVREVVGRMDHLSDASPELALAVLTDTAQVQDIERAVTADNEDALEETVEAAYSDKARELQQAAMASEQRSVEAERARLLAEQRIVESEKDHERAREEIQRLENERDSWRGQQEELAEDLARVKRERADVARIAEERLRSVEQRVERDAVRRALALRVATGLALIALGLSAALVLTLVFVSGKWAMVGAIVGGAALVLLGTRVLAGRRWGGEILIWCTLLAGVAGIAVAIAAGSH